MQTPARGSRVTALLRTTSGLSSELVPPFSALGSLAQASAATEEESWAETCTHMARFITEYYLHIDKLFSAIAKLTAFDLEIIQNKYLLHST